MAAPIFGKHWYEKSDLERGQAMEQFRAAVSTARNGSDEAIRQVCLLTFLVWFMGGCGVWCVELVDQIQVVLDELIVLAGISFLESNSGFYPEA